MDILINLLGYSIVCGLILFIAYHIGRSNGWIDEDDFKFDFNWFGWFDNDEDK